MVWSANMLYMYAYISQWYLYFVSMVLPCPRKRRRNSWTVRPVLFFKNRGMTIIVYRFSSWSNWKNWLVVTGTFGFFFHSVGNVKSSQLTFIFFRGLGIVPSSKSWIILYVWWFLKHLIQKLHMVASQAPSHHDINPQKKRLNVDIIGLTFLGFQDMTHLGFEKPPVFCAKCQAHQRLHEAIESPTTDSTDLGSWWCGGWCFVPLCFTT